ncbi:CDP-alcohol phosphatidyltransferase family protein [Patulibacter sp. NPDC049589]|uniref:CDP-alcohol phosphatidyltransferase family protein n=1 Tax=Patulibacter sp. NPDC049589 TaxID=3154731 RepID=UPI0034189978
MADDVAVTYRRSSRARRRASAPADRCAGGEGRDPRAVALSPSTGDRPDEEPRDDGTPPPVPDAADPADAEGSLRRRADRARATTRKRRDQVREKTKERTDHVRERTRERTEQVRERTDQVRDRAMERTEHVRERTRELTEPARMTVYRLFGIDRSGPPPIETLAGQPLRVWTIPNAVGLIRLAFIPVFLVLALSTDGGTDALPALVFLAIAASDYLDGFLARLTGQYSRFGTLLDPLTDRALVVAGGIVCWHFDLLPREALGVLVARELYTTDAARRALKKDVRLGVNWWGRLAVWPLMSGLFAALVGVGWPAKVAVVIGVAMAIMATIRYERDGRRQLRERAAAAAAAPSVPTAGANG